MHKLMQLVLCLSIIAGLIGWGRQTTHAVSVASTASSNISIPFISQYKPGSPTNPTQNCGPTSVAMILKAYGLGSGLEDYPFVEEVRARTGKPDGNTNTDFSDLKRAIASYGLTYADTSGSFDIQIQQMKDVTALARPIIVLVNADILGRTGVGNHWIVVRGFSSTNETVYVNDPDLRLAADADGKLPGWKEGAGHNKAWSFVNFKAAVQATGYSNYGIIVGNGVGVTDTSVSLFDLPGLDSNGSALQINSAGFYNLPTWMNDSASSISVPSGWAVRVYEHANRAGGYKDFNRSDSNLADDNFAGINYSLSVNNAISSIEVYSGVCSPAATSVSRSAGFAPQGCEPPPGPTPTPGPGGATVSVLSVSPDGTSFEGGQAFFPSVTVQTSGIALQCGVRDFIENIDGNLYDTHPIQGCESLGNSTYRFAFGDDMRAPEQQGSYVSRWKVHYAGNLIGPEIALSFNVGQPNNGPGTPQPLSPENGQIIYGFQAPRLCATPVTDPDGDAVFYTFEIYESAQVRQSSALSEPCWQPQLDPANVHHTYRWHVRAKDSRGKETAWGASATFTLAPPPAANPRPISAPPALPTTPIVNAEIWNPAAPLYRILPIVTGSDLPTGTLVKVDGLDLQPLIAAGKITPEYSNLHVVRRIDATHWQEVARAAYTPWDVEFFLPAPVPAGRNEEYYLIYGGPAATPPTYAMPRGFFLDLYLDKWGESWNQTISFESSIDFTNTCEPPINHRERTGGSAFDDADGARGRIFIPATGSWTFKVFMPDGYRLSLDRQEIGRFDGYDSVSKWLTVGTRDLKAGWYDLDLHDMWVNCGSFKLALAGPGFPEQIVPGTAFQKFWANTQHVTPGEEKFFDQIPPTTTFSASPAHPTGRAGWYTTSCTIALTAVDNPDGSGVADTWLTVNDGPPTRYTGPLTLEADGVYAVTYFSRDRAGNVEQAKRTTISIDRTAPHATIALAGTLGNAGWYITPVQVTGQASDPSPGSGVERLEWTVDGVNWQPYTPTATYATEGIGSLMLRAIDVAGNVQSIPTRVEIKLDTRAPEVTASLGMSQYTRAQTATVTARAGDPTPGSGIVSVTRTLNGEAVTDQQVLDLLFRPLGLYTLTVIAVDAAGWKTIGTASFELIASIVGLRDTIPLLRARGEITQDGIANALMAKVESALASKERGNIQAAINQLRALQQQINAQAGKKLSQQAAVLLNQDIEYVIALLVGN